MESPTRRHHDVSTVVSILPYPIDEPKPGLNPNRFKMAAAREHDFELLVIERCSHSVYIDENRPSLSVPDPSDVVAQSIVFDHKTAKLDYEGGTAEPGIGWVPGAYENDANGKSAFKMQHQSLLTELHRLQTGWFHRLVRSADDAWGKHRQHKFITDIERVAATRLGITDRDWQLTQQIEAAMSKCRFCFSLVHPEAIICSSCRGILNADRYAKEFVSVPMAETVKPAGQSK